MAILTRRSLLRGSLAFGAAGSLARPHIANAAATTAEVWCPTGLRQGGGCRLQEDGRRLREGERQQDRLQHHSVRGAAPEGSLGDHERRGPGCDGGLRSRVCPVERLGRQARRCRRHCRDAESGFRPGRHRFLLSLQQRHETARLLHGADEDQRRFRSISGGRWSRRRATRSPIFRTPGMPFSISSSRCRTSCARRGCATSMPTAIS